MSAPEQDHLTEVYYDAQSGSHGWRCSCGRNSRAILPLHAAEHAIKMHRTAISPRTPDRLAEIKQRLSAIPELRDTCTVVTADGETRLIDGACQSCTNSWRQLLSEEVEAFPAFTCERTAGQDISWLIAALDRAWLEIGARTGAWQRLNQSYDQMTNTATLRHDQAKRAERWLSKIADELGVEPDEPSALISRVRDLTAEVERLRAKNGGAE